MKVIQNLIDGTAVAYYLAYKCIMERNREVCDYYHDSISVYIFPAITVAALSCEIAIKNHISLASKTAVRGHDLYKLFNSMSQDNIDKYSQITISLYNARLELLHTKQETNFTLEDFKEELFRCKDTFTDCRYLYEGGFTVNVNFLESLMFSLNDVEDDFREFLIQQLNRIK